MEYVLVGVNIRLLTKNVIVILKMLEKFSVSTIRQRMHVSKVDGLGVIKLTTIVFTNSEIAYISLHPLS